MHVHMFTRSLSLIPLYIMGYDRAAGLLSTNHDFGCALSGPPEMATCLNPLVTVVAQRVEA